MSFFLNPDAADLFWISLEVSHMDAGIINLIIYILGLAIMAYLLLDAYKVSKGS